MQNSNRGQKLSTFNQNLLLVCSTLLLTLLIIEMYFRIFDPVPYVDPIKINQTEHGNFTQYDSVLGWRGIPNAKGYLATHHRNIQVQHNHLGFRDIEHPSLRASKTIAFLGDSFTWGYNVEFDEMFVTRLRNNFLAWDIYNLAHIGYGTDQSLLTFKDWRQVNQIDWAILMFSPNDFADNNSNYRYFKFKPQYVLKNGTLKLTNVPVPGKNQWISIQQETKSTSLKHHIYGILFRSHAIHDIAFRLSRLVEMYERMRANGNQPDETVLKKDRVEITKHLIGLLKNEIASKKGEMIVVAIPAKSQFSLRNSNHDTSHTVIEDICLDLGIKYLDLAPFFKQAKGRKYYRGNDIHWTPLGHQLASEAIAQFLLNIGLDER